VKFSSLIRSRKATDVLPETPGSAPSLTSKLAALSGRPVQVNRMVVRETKARVPHTVYILLDCSGSMSGDKLAQGKQGADGFAAQAVDRGYSVGLISFACDAEVVVAPEYRETGLGKGMGCLAASGGTNMSAALDLGLRRLSKLDGQRAMCVVTDGMPDNRDATIAAAQRAKEAGIDILTIGTDDADGEFLKAIASRQELARHVQRMQLAAGIESMAKLLPAKNTRRISG